MSFFCWTIFPFNVKSYFILKIKMSGFNNSISFNTFLRIFKCKVTSVSPSWQHWAARYTLKYGPVLTVHSVLPALTSAGTRHIAIFAKENFFDWPRALILFPLGIFEDNLIWGSIFIFSYNVRLFLWLIHFYYVADE